MDANNFLETRIAGPHEIYARWNFDKVTFDRRDGSLESDALRYIRLKDFKLSQIEHSKDFFELLPAEPFFPLLAKIIGIKKGMFFSSEQYAKIRLHLLNNKLINYKWIDFQKYDGSVYNSTPYFLNALGKYYYQHTFGLSADTTAKGFYRSCVISNKDCSVRHIYHLEKFYKNNDHEVVVGKYPFDLIVDNKHAFILTEMHENSIGIEMRVSEAIFQSIRNGFNLYFPSMTPEHRRRTCGIIAGLLFEYKSESYTFASYLETDICSDSNVNNWSYFLTNSKEHGRAPIFQDSLEFPKISLTSDKIIGTQLTNIHEKIQEKNKISFFYSLRYINGMNNKEICPGVKATIGYGQIQNLWKDMANGADVLITGKVRSTLLDNIHVPPRMMIIDSFNLEEHQIQGKYDSFEDDERSVMTATQVYRVFEKKNVEMIMLPRNHAKAILKGYKFLVHSMTTTHYMGNNRESFILIDFSDHPQKEEIHQSLLKMLIAFGHDSPKEFIPELAKVREMFKDKIRIFGHFSGTETVDWVYYKELIRYSNREKVCILTSHVDMKGLVKNAELIRIQGTSRFANYNSLMLANCPVMKERMWHPRMIYNKRFVGAGSWDFAQITDQKELQVICIMPEYSSFYEKSSQKSQDKPTGFNRVSSHSVTNHGTTRKNRIQNRAQKRL
ncbi:hypothetical protein [uncultured Methanomethylovorans sp.]|uniref:hypothetical protein n=1 Tax=uncultured Methanomethylovorans sp. TaxID=183759 RepID=UPI002AA8AC73|nr:hypothetical protein [uncultured Methanomethylovorans sp.]